MIIYTLTDSHALFLGSYPSISAAKEPAVAMVMVAAAIRGVVVARRKGISIR